MISLLAPIFLVYFSFFWYQHYQLISQDIDQYLPRIFFSHSLISNIINKLDIQNFSRYRLVDHSRFIVSIKEEFEQLKTQKLFDEDKMILITELNKYWTLLKQELKHIDKLNKPLEFLPRYILALVYQSNFLSDINLKLDRDLYLSEWITSWLHVSWATLDELHDCVVCLYQFSKLSKDQGHFFINKNDFSSLFAKKINELPIDKINIALYKRQENPANSLTRIIGNFILGCGYLALQDCVVQLQAKQLNILFKMLLEYSPHAVDPTQALATFVLGAGYLAKGKCHIELDNSETNKALELILFYRNKTRDATLPLSSFTLGLGYIGLEGFPVQLDSNLVNAALDIFYTSGLKSGQLVLHFTNFLLGIGYLGLRKCVAKVDKDKIQKLFKLFLNTIGQSEDPSRLTANFILSIGYLAEQKYTIPLETNDINTALQIILKHQGIAEKIEINIVNYFKGISYLVSSGCSIDIHSHLANQAYEILLKQVTNNNKKLSILSDFILSLGFIAINNKIIAVDESNVLKAMQIIVKSKIKTAEYLSVISDFFVGIGYFAIKHYMIKLDGENIRQLLQFVIEMVDEYKLTYKGIYSAVSNIFWAIANLAEINYIIEIPAIQVKDILQIVLAYPSISENFPRDMNNIFLGLGHYAINRQPIVLDVLQIHSLFSLLHEHFSDSAKNFTNLISILWVWAVYAQNDVIIESDQIAYFAEEVINYMEKFDEKDTHKFIIFLNTYQLLTLNRPLNISLALLLQLEQKEKRFAKRPNQLQLDLKNWLKRSYNINDESDHLEHLISGYFVDIAVVVGSIKLILEIDGDHHYESDGSLRKKDKIRDNFLSKFNYQINRLKNNAVRQLINGMNPELKKDLDQLFIGNNMQIIDHRVPEHATSSAMTEIESASALTKKLVKKSDELLISKREKLSGKSLMSKAEKKLKKECPNIAIHPSEKCAAIDLVDKALNEYDNKIALISEKDFDEMCHQIISNIINAVYKKSACQYYMFIFYNIGINYGIRLNKNTHPQQALSKSNIEEIIKQFVQLPKSQISLQR